MKARTWEVPQWVVCPWVRSWNANPSYKCSLVTCLTHKSDVSVAVCQEDAVDTGKTWKEMRPCGYLRVKRTSRFTLRHTLARLFSMEQLSSITLLPLTPSAVLFVFGPASPHSLHRYHMHHAASAFSSTWGIWCQCSVCCGEAQPRVSSPQSSELRQSSININNAHCLCSRFGFGMKIKLMVLINLIHMHALILNILFHDNLQFCREKNVSEIGHWHRLHDFDELFIQRRIGIHL